MLLSTTFKYLQNPAGSHVVPTGFAVRDPTERAETRSPLAGSVLLIPIVSSVKKKEFPAFPILRVTVRTRRYAEPNIYTEAPVAATPPLHFLDECFRHASKEINQAGETAQCLRWCLEKWLWRC